MDMYQFYTGKSFEAYKFLGAHVQASGTRFSTFAPNASSISVIGDFNHWEETPMQQVHDGNFYELFLPEAKEGMLYKYRIFHQDGSYMDHCDPYGFGMELRPNCASIIRDLNNYQFHDEKWMQQRTDCREKPLNIYEVHLGSFRTNPEDPNGWYKYNEIGELLIPYVKENGYNYIEFMPLSEHPSDESWGYQNTGFFSPTSRYGTAKELKELVDMCHDEGIGVIMDFVPVHFAIDDYALAKYDGTELYEYPHSDVGMSEWGSYNFMHSRGEICSFLQSAANYWLTEYHFDGIRMDAISRMIYWQGDPARGVNGNAVAFIKTMNQGLKSLHPSAILSAEDSTNFSNVTKPVSEGGLGFDYKWDMGWMNDTLEYFKKSPKERVEHYHNLTFSMMYYYGETFLLPFSHDETVHGKATILQKMHGDYEDKFPQGRALYMYMFAHPGKKLNFMGNEIGQLREWDEKREQDWDILSYPTHDAFHKFMILLNRLYLEHSAFYMWDYKEKGFQWLDCHQEALCIYAFERVSKDDSIISVFNFSDKPVKDFELKIGLNKTLEILLSSNWENFGGTEKETPLRVKADKKGMVTLNLSPYSAYYFSKIKS